MEKLLFILGVTLGSIAAGYVARRVIERGPAPSEALATASRYMKLAAFFVIQPLGIVSTFWTMTMVGGQELLFPVLGIASVSVGGAVALIAGKVFHISPKRAASVFVSGMFTNVLTIGGLVGFVFFGERGYSLAQLFNMLIPASYYVVGYPVSNNIANSAGRILRIDFRVMAERPLIFVPVVAMVLGLILNLTGVVRPPFFNSLVAVIVPTVSILLGLAIGISLRFSKVREYVREIGIVAMIKFLIIPAVIIPLGILFGLPAVGDGTTFRMLIVMSVMPVAFNALVPPAIFGFDLDLANSAWIVTTAALIVIVPVLSLVLL